MKTHIQFQGCPQGTFGGQSDNGQVLLQVLQFPLPGSILPVLMSSQAGKLGQ